MRGCNLNFGPVANQPLDERTIRREVGRAGNNEFSLAARRRLCKWCDFSRQLGRREVVAEEKALLPSFRDRDSEFEGCSAKVTNGSRSRLDCLDDVSKTDRFAEEEGLKYV